MRCAFYPSRKKAPSAFCKHTSPDRNSLILRSNALFARNRNKIAVQGYTKRREAAVSNNMQNVIAVIWDFDKTLIPGYMQEPLFNHFKADGSAFWQENQRLIRELKDKGVEVNSDTFYLNLILRHVKGGEWPGLSNDLLFSLGSQIKVREGAAALLQKIKALGDNERYKRHNIAFENYIVSTGLKRMVMGSELGALVDHIWGCEFTEDDAGSVSEVAYSIDNTTKTRAIFEINKGVHFLGGNVDVNTKIAKEDRRVQFSNMVYVADGPSDVPAYSIVNQYGGSTLAVYDRESPDNQSFLQAKELLDTDRVDIIAEADFLEGSLAYKWIMSEVTEMADSIIRRHEESWQRYKRGTPGHIVE
jgi:hypothetical protein